MKTGIYLQIFDSAEKDTQPFKTCIIQVLAIPEFSSLYTCPAVCWSWAGLVLAWLCYETLGSAKLQFMFQLGPLVLLFSVNSAVPTAVRKCSDFGLFSSKAVQHAWKQGNGLCWPGLVDLERCIARNALKSVHMRNNRFPWLGIQIPWPGYLSLFISDWFWITW